MEGIRSSEEPARKAGAVARPLWGQHPRLPRGSRSLRSAKGHGGERPGSGTERQFPRTGNTGLSPRRSGFDPRTLDHAASVQWYGRLILSQESTGSIPVRGTTLGAGPRTSCRRGRPCDGESGEAGGTEAQCPCGPVPPFRAPTCTLPGVPLGVGACLLSRTRWVRSPPWQPQGVDRVAQVRGCNPR